MSTFFCRPVNLPRFPLLLFDSWLPLVACWRRRAMVLCFKVGALPSSTKMGFTPRRSKYDVRKKRFLKEPKKKYKKHNHFFWKVDTSRQIKAASLLNRWGFVVLVAHPYCFRLTSKRQQVWFLETAPRHLLPCLDSFSSKRLNTISINCLWVSEKNLVPDSKW